MSQSGPTIVSDGAAPTACVLLIGNELLSGKTQDANLQFLGRELAGLGIRLGECRVVRDDHDAIIAHLNECRARYTYVFTTGGIGPTHDDITAEAVAAAFGVPLVVDAEAKRRLEAYGRELNEARLKMARVPEGASLIDNPISHAPGFRMDNVFVLAGIPSIARAMFSAAAAELRHGAAIHSASVDVWLREGDFAAVLERIAAAHADVEIGSYPFARDGRFGANLVVRGTDADIVEAVLARITAEMDALGGEPERRT
ncbi:MAG: competence/damage-inducible protein A [Gammaproteobacteria bacterium]|nr:competence/damage-inducible protein A [Gammaproteobacteria bacterium]